MSMAERIVSNLRGVKDRIADAASVSGRSAEDVRLVAVTKYHDAETTRLVVDAGCFDLGENRPQQLWEKAESLSDQDGIVWHQIGHLQRNKVAKTVPLIGLLHSVDSVRLLKEVDKAVAETRARLDVLLEVNVSGDESKHGWRHSEMAQAVDAAIEFTNVRICGLMTMATLGGDDETVRRDFASLRQLRDRLQSHVGSAASLSELSMGMSGDYEIAIEEGATIVRVGSAIYK